MKPLTFIAVVVMLAGCGTQPTGTSTNNDFAQCRDQCYAERSDCFDRGEETGVCESQYDECAARCEQGASGLPT